MNIAVIEKHSFIRTSIGFLLGSGLEGSTILEAENLSQFCKDFCGQKIDLFILGISDLKSPHIPKQVLMLSRFFSAAKFMVYDGNPSYSKVLQCLKCGAEGYLTLSSGASEMKECVTEIFQGKKYYSSEIISQVLDHLIKVDNETDGESAARLTRREYDIAAYLIEGMNTSAIAKRLERKASTISTIKSNIYRKLGVNNIIALKEAINAAPYS